MDLENVAAFSGIAAGRLESFETGERDPSRRQVERLADIYGVPTYSLFSNSIPTLPNLPQDFRKKNPSPASLSPKGMRTLWSSEQISQFAKQLAVELDYRPADLSRSAGGANSANQKAARLRAAFDEWFEPREAKLKFSGPPEQVFMSALRLFFEIQGGVLNVNDAPAGDYMGFFVKPDRGLPTVFVNRSISSKKAQLFTLAHEYAHALSETDGISNPFQLSNEIERTCNIFAAEFLEPMDHFNEVINQISRSSRVDTTTFISEASSQSLLSKHATALRLVEGGYITREKYREWRRIFRSNPRAEKDDEKEAAEVGPIGAPHAKRLGELGYLPIILSRLAISEKLIDSYDVSAGIGLSPTLQEKAFSLAARRFEVALS